MSEQVHCLLCTISTPVELVSPVVRDDLSGNFKIVRCLTCGHVQLSPLPSPEVEKALYQTDSHTRQQMGSVDFALEQHKAVADTSRRVNWLQSVLLSQEGGEILDVGCGYGFFVAALASLGYKATGIDVGTERLALAGTHLPGTFIEGEVDEAFVIAHTYQFRGVTLFHVLEHVRNPVAFLRQCLDLVAPGGYLLIEVPNLGDELLDQHPQYRAFHWQLAHLSYFDSAHMSLALYRAGQQEFALRGVQRYGLRNLLHWLDTSQPQLTDPDYRVIQPPILAHVEELYRADRERALTSDTLIVEVRK